MMSMTLATVMAALAWRPFLDPLDLHDYWVWLLIPVSAAIAVVYKTLKLQDLSQLGREAAKLTVLIVASMIAAAAGLWVVTWLAI